MKDFEWSIGELPSLPKIGQIILLYPKLEISDTTLSEKLYQYMGTEQKGGYDHSNEKYQSRKQIKKYMESLKDKPFDYQYTVYVFHPVKAKNNILKSYKSKALWLSKTQLKNNYKNWEVFDKNMLMAFL